MQDIVLMAIEAGAARDRPEGLYIAAVAIAACTVAVAVPAFHAILAVIIGARVDVNSAGDERLVLCLC